MSDEEEKKTARFSISLSPSEMERVDQWAWSQRIRSLSEAGRKLILAALDASEQPEAATKKPRRKPPPQT